MFTWRRRNIEWMTYPVAFLQTSFEASRSADSIVRVNERLRGYIWDLQDNDGMPESASFLE